MGITIYGSAVDALFTQLAASTTCVLSGALFDSSLTYTIQRVDVEGVVLAPPNASDNGTDNFFLSWPDVQTYLVSSS